MAVISRFILLALLALILCVDASLDHDHAARDVVRGHDAIAKRKRAAFPAPDDATPDDDSTPATDADDSDSDDNSTTPAANVTDVLERSVSKQVGIGWPNVFQPNVLKHWKSPHVHGMYTWSPWCPSLSDTSGIPCYPMFWGYKSIGKWHQWVTGHHWDYVFGANEANQNGQSKMSPAQACAIHGQYFSPLVKKGTKVISPSCSSSNTALTWYKGYKSHCPQYWAETHAVAAHWYGTDPNKFITYIESLHNTLHKNIWVTEVGCVNFSGRGPQCNTEMANHLFSTIIAWMRKQAWIEWYSWYGMFHDTHAGVSPVNALMNSNGTPNSKGIAYINPS